PRGGERAGDRIAHELDRVRTVRRVTEIAHRQGSAQLFEIDIHGTPRKSDVMGIGTMSPGPTSARCELPNVQLQRQKPTPDPSWVRGLINRRNTTRMMDA